MNKSLYIFLTFFRVNHRLWFIAGHSSFPAWLFGVFGHFLMASAAYQERSVPIAFTYFFVKPLHIFC